MIGSRFAFVDDDTEVLDLGFEERSFFTVSVQLGFPTDGGAPGRVEPRAYDRAGRWGTRRTAVE